jgi:hypothetical protein
MGGGITAVMLVGSLASARFNDRVATFLDSWKVMKRGVVSPSKGATFPSVVLPKKLKSVVAGGAGDGDGTARILSKRDRMKAPAETAFEDLLVDGVEAVPLSNVIWILKFGWSGLFGFTESCSSFGSAQLHSVVGATQPLSSSTASGCAIVDMPVGIGG